MNVVITEEMGTPRYFIKMMIIMMTTTVAVATTTATMMMTVKDEADEIDTDIFNRYNNWNSNANMNYRPMTTSVGYRRSKY